MASKELKPCNVYFDPFLFVWAKILASEIYNESPDAKRMEVPDSDFWYQGIAPITIEFENRGDILIWSNKAIKKTRKRINSPCISSKQCPYRKEENNGNT